MKTIGNIIWVVFGGLISAIVLLFEAAFWCITIIGIPIGVKLFQLASFRIALLHHHHRDPLRAAILQDRPLRLDPARLRLR